MVGDSKKIILENLPCSIADNLHNVSFADLEEVRLRAGRRLALFNHCESITLPYTITGQEIEQTLRMICRSSVYAYIEEIKNCFITLQGGHRVGLCGRVVLQDNQIINMVQLNGLNFRIAREVKGAADKIMPYITKHNLQNTLIISPPQCGKTTIIRDAARQLGKWLKVSIIDERGEIAAMRDGVPQHDIGELTDVLDLCPKAIGIPLMLRSMSPDVIITDEIAHCDVDAICKALSCGVKIIATAHGDNAEQVKRRIMSDNIMEEFGCIITLSRKKGVGTIENVA
ncbi:MAG: stage III sporulation protein AA [Clostridiaceae bacterium]|nr:stage III sporulation protein AA [Clostridiaceae bacterium]